MPAVRRTADPEAEPKLVYSQNVASDFYFTSDGRLVLDPSTASATGTDALQPGTIYMLDIDCGNLIPLCSFLAFHTRLASTTHPEEKERNTPGVAVSTMSPDGRFGKPDGSGSSRARDLALSIVLPAVMILFLVFVTVVTLIRKRRHHAVHLAMHDNGGGGDDAMELGELGADGAEAAATTVDPEADAAPETSLGVMPNGFFTNRFARIPEKTRLLSGLPAMHYAVLMVRPWPSAGRSLGKGLGKRKTALSGARLNVFSPAQNDEDALQQQLKSLSLPANGAGSLHSLPSPSSCGTASHGCVALFTTRGRGGVVVILTFFFLFFFFFLVHPTASTAPHPSNSLGPSPEHDASSAAASSPTNSVADSPRQGDPSAAILDARRNLSR